jgi:hypothetical protein
MERRSPLARGQLPRVAWRLGRAHATGVLTIWSPRDHGEVMVLRRGSLITGEQDVGGRQAAGRLSRLSALDGGSWSFDGGTAAYPPGAQGRQLALDAWARQHLESQLDAARADQLVADFAGARIAIRPDHAPEPLDDTDRRMLAAMSQPRRLDQIWPLARTPRFRLLAFLHFLRSVGALTLVGIAAERYGSGPLVAPAVHAEERTEALRTLGLQDEAGPEAVKRAYRRLARALHPDLQPGIDDARRRELEARLAEVAAAYRQLSA